MTTNKIIINFNVSAKTDDDIPVKMAGLDSTWGDVLRRGILLDTTSGDRMEIYGWCKDLQDFQRLELTDAEFNRLKQIIENCPQTTGLVAPIIKIMLNAKDEGERLRREQEENDRQAKVAASKTDPNKDK